MKTPEETTPKPVERARDARFAENVIRSKEARLLVNGTAWEEEIEKARAELLAFENDNALLLQGQEAK